MPNPTEGSKEGFQFPFEGISSASPKITQKPELTKEQRIAIEVEALASGQNLPLSLIIKGIKENHSEGGTNTTLLNYPRKDGTMGHIEATLGELETIQEMRKNAAHNKAPRRRRLKGL